MHMGEDGGLSDGRPSVVASAPTSDRTLGTPPLAISRLGFGAWGLAARDWDARVDANAALRAIERALDLGITLFDTAPSYGSGESETLLGRVVGGRSGAARRDRMLLATKCGPYDDPRTSLEASLRRLRSDRVELFQLHEIPTESGAMERQLERMHALMERGLARAIGVCNATSRELSRALTVVPVASYQGPYNLLDRDAEHDAFACAHSHGIAALAYRPLASGMLTGKYTTPPHFAATDHRSRIHWFRGREFARRHAVVDALRPIARAQGLTVTQLALAWALCRPGVTAVLAGARTEAQVDENAKAARVSLSVDVMTAIDAAVDRVYAPRALRRDVEVADSADATGDVMVRMCDRGIVRTLVVGEREAYVMRRLDGRTPYACIAAEWESTDGTRLLAAQVVLLADQLADLGLLEDVRDA
ncbi:MAG TPA: aldo/keto reductase [Gemmatimonadaceae bacterium]|nr:aldo/keto reductase [Gemmatimonadaceae bacterium]